ncbi:MAG: O-methyltransferase [Candidatus Thermoplasmatota archaeon]
MPASYEKFDYTLRPAKSVERRLIAETVRKLSVLGDVSLYRYIGFGSVAFADFVLFHKALGIDDMISVEREEGDLPRFEFNKPFQGIVIEPGRSDNVLPRLDWRQKTFLWLDYEGPIDDAALADVDLFVTEAAVGSVAFVSANAQAILTDEMKKTHKSERALERMSELVTGGRLPTELKPDDLHGTKLTTLFRQLIRDQIGRALSARNAGASAATRVFAKEVFDVEYRDGARMMTFGFLIHRADQRALVAGSGLDNLDWVPKSALDPPFSIELPLLTVRERRHLEGQFPYVKLDEVDPDWLRELGAEQYRRFYRHYPNYVDLEM